MTETSNGLLTPGQDIPPREGLLPRFARGAFWSIVGAVVSRLFMLGAAVFAARFLGKTGFGELGMVQSTMGLFGVFAGFGLGLTSTKYVAEFHHKDPDRAGRIISLTGIAALISAGLMAGLCLVLAPWLARATINAPHLSPALRAGALFMFVSALVGAMTGALAGFEAFKSVARVNLWQGIVSLPVTFILVYLAGLQGAIAALTISAAVGLYFASVALARECRASRVNLHISRAIWAERACLWTFSLPVAMANAAVGPVYWITNAFLVNQPDGYAEMGVFNVGLRWRMLAMFLPTTLSAPILAILSSVYNSEKGFGRSLNLQVKCVWGIGLVTTCAIALGAMLLTVPIWGDEFVDGVGISVLLLSTSFMVCVGTAGWQAIVASDRAWHAAAATGLWGFLYILFGWLLVPRYGAWGLACAQWGAYLVYFVVVLRYIQTAYSPQSALVSPRTAAATCLAMVGVLGAAVFAGHNVGLALAVGALAVSGWIAWQLIWPLWHERGPTLAGCLSPRQRPPARDINT